MAQFPNVPPLGDKTLPGFEAATWYGLYAPKGTTKEVIQKMHQAYLKAMTDKAWTMTVHCRLRRRTPIAPAAPPCAAAAASLVAAPA